MKKTGYTGYMLDLECKFDPHGISLGPSTAPIFFLSMILTDLVARNIKLIQPYVVI